MANFKNVKATNGDKKRYTINIASAENPGGILTGTVFTMDLSLVEADAVRRVAQASREARVLARLDPVISISETVYCDKRGMPCFSSKECDDCIVLRAKGWRTAK